MNRKTTGRLWLGVCLTMLCSGIAYGQPVLSEDGALTWEALATERPAGVEDGRWQRLVGQLKANGLSLEVARECLVLVQEAERQGLPADPVLTRIEEGAAKRAEAKALQEAGRQRLLNLQNAAAVLRQSGYGSRNTVHDQLMKSVALALESGLSANTLQSVLTRTRGTQSERMRSIVEAGESMHLNGMDEATVGQMMTDFTERNMRRTEVMRACRFAVQQHHAHVEGARIRQQLWDGTGAGGQWHGGAHAPGAGGPAADTGRPADRGSRPGNAGGPSGSGGSSSSSGGASMGTGSGGSGGGSGSGSGSGTQPGPGPGGPSSSPGGSPSDSGSGGPGGAGNGSGSDGQGGNMPTDAGNKH